MDFNNNLCDCIKIEDSVKKRNKFSTIKNSKHNSKAEQYFRCRISCMNGQGEKDGCHCQNRFSFG